MIIPRPARFALIYLFLTLLPGFAFANGGGYTRASESDGGLKLFVPEAAEHVRILTEDLTIHLGTSRAQVNVVYSMQNEGRGRKVKLGFPVERVQRAMWEQDADKNAPFKGLPGYQITLDDQPVKADAQTEAPEAEDIDPRRKGLAGWMVSTLSFRDDGVHKVAVSYSCGYEYSLFQISRNGHLTPSIFRYRLSTASVWRGTIGAGKVTLSGGALTLPGFSILHPRQGFVKQSKAYVWEFNDLEPTMADDIVVQITPGSEYQEARNAEGQLRYRYSKEGGSWFFETRDFTASASSTLESDRAISYEPALAHDWKMDTAWVEAAQGDGVGEWLELNVKNPRKFSAILLRNGYQTTEALWRANNRVARFKVTLNGKFTFAADVEDDMGEQFIPIPKFDEAISKVRLEVAAVHRGAEFQDTAITDVALRGSLSKPPKLQPSR